MGVYTKITLKSPKLITLIVILAVSLSCICLFVRGKDEASITTGENSSNSRVAVSDPEHYLNWISDNANVLSTETKEYLASKNMALDNTYGGLVAVKTASSLNSRDIQVYAEETAKNIGLDKRDILLFLDTNSGSWYVTYGADLESYVGASADLPNLFREHLKADFWEEGGANQILPGLFDDLEDWYKENIPSSITSRVPVDAGGELSSDSILDIQTVEKNEVEASGVIDKSAKESIREFLSSIYCSLIGSRLSN